MLWAHQNCRQEAAARLDSGGQTACTGPYAMHPAGECCVSWLATQLQGGSREHGHAKYASDGGFAESKGGQGGGSRIMQVHGSSKCVWAGGSG